MRPLTLEQRDGLRATTEATFERPLIRRRFATVEDRYGNETRGQASDVAFLGVLWPEESTEATEDRDEQVADWLGRAPLGFDITGRDQVVADGQVFEVVGPPANVGTHLRFRLRHVEG